MLPARKVWQPGSTLEWEAEVEEELKRLGQGQEGEECTATLEELMTELEEEAGGEGAQAVHLGAPGKKLSPAEFERLKKGRQEELARQKSGESGKEPKQQEVAQPNRDEFEEERNQEEVARPDREKFEMELDVFLRYLGDYQQNVRLSNANFKDQQDVVVDYLTKYDASSTPYALNQEIFKRDDGFFFLVRDYSSAKAIWRKEEQKYQELKAEFDQKFKILADRVAKELAESAVPSNWKEVLAALEKQSDEIDKIQIQISDIVSNHAKTTEALTTLFKPRDVYMTVAELDALERAMGTFLKKVKVSDGDSDAIKRCIERSPTVIDRRNSKYKKIEVSYNNKRISLSKCAEKFAELYGGLEPKSDQLSKTREKIKKLSPLLRSMLQNLRPDDKSEIARSATAEVNRALMEFMPLVQLYTQECNEINDINKESIKLARLLNKAVEDADGSVDKLERVNEEDDAVSGSKDEPPAGRGDAGRGVDRPAGRGDAGRGEDRPAGRGDAGRGAEDEDAFAIQWVNHWWMTGDGRNQSEINLHLFLPVLMNYFRKSGNFPSDIVKVITSGPENTKVNYTPEELTVLRASWSHFKRYRERILGGTDTVQAADEMFQNAFYEMCTYFFELDYTKIEHGDYIITLFFMLKNMSGNTNFDQAEHNERLVTTGARDVSRHEMRRLYQKRLHEARGSGTKPGLRFAVYDVGRVFQRLDKQYRLFCMNGLEMARDELLSDDAYRENDIFSRDEVDRVIECETWIFLLKFVQFREDVIVNKDYMRLLIKFANHMKKYVWSQPAADEVKRILRELSLVVFNDLLKIRNPVLQNAQRVFLLVVTSEVDISEEKEERYMNGSIIRHVLFVLTKCMRDRKDQNKEHHCPGFMDFVYELFRVLIPDKSRYIEGAIRSFLRGELESLGARNELRRVLEEHRGHTARIEEYIQSQARLYGYEMFEGAARKIIEEKVKNLLQPAADLSENLFLTDLTDIDAKFCDQKDEQRQLIADQAEMWFNHQAEVYMLLSPLSQHPKKSITTHLSDEAWAVNHHFFPLVRDKNLSAQNVVAYLESYEQNNYRALVELIRSRKQIISWVFIIKNGVKTKMNYLDHCFGTRLNELSLFVDKYSQFKMDGQFSSTFATYSKLRDHLSDLKIFFLEKTLNEFEGELINLASLLADNSALNFWLEFDKFCLRFKEQTRFRDEDVRRRLDRIDLTPVDPILWCFSEDDIFRDQKRTAKDQDRRRREEAAAEDHVAHAHRPASHRRHEKRAADHERRPAPDWRAEDHERKSAPDWRAEDHERRSAPDWRGGRRSEDDEWMPHEGRFESRHSSGEIGHVEHELAPDPGWRDERHHEHHSGGARPAPREFVDFEIDESRIVVENLRMYVDTAVNGVTQILRTRVGDAPDVGIYTRMSLLFPGVDVRQASEDEIDKNYEAALDWTTTFVRLCFSFFMHIYKYLQAVKVAEANRGAMPQSKLDQLQAHYGDAMERILKHVLDVEDRSDTFKVVTGCTFAELCQLQVYEFVWKVSDFCDMLSKGQKPDSIPSFFKDNIEWNEQRLEGLMQRDTDILKKGIPGHRRAIQEFYDYFKKDTFELLTGYQLKLQDISIFIVYILLPLAPRQYISTAERDILDQLIQKDETLLRDWHDACEIIHDDFKEVVSSQDEITMMASKRRLEMLASVLTWAMPPEIDLRSVISLSDYVRGVPELAGALGRYYSGLNLEFNLELIVKGFEIFENSEKPVVLQDVLWKILSLYVEIVTPRRDVVGKVFRALLEVLPCIKHECKHDLPLAYALLACKITELLNDGGPTADVWFDMVKHRYLPKERRTWTGIIEAEKQALDAMLAAGKDVLPMDFEGHTKDLSSLVVELVEHGSDTRQEFQKQMDLYERFRLLGEIIDTEAYYIHDRKIGDRLAILTRVFRYISPKIMEARLKQHEMSERLLENEEMLKSLREDLVDLEVENEELNDELRRLTHGGGIEHLVGDRAGAPAAVGGPSRARTSGPRGGTIRPTAARHGSGAAAHSDLESARREVAKLRDYIERLQDWGRNLEARAKEDFAVAQKVREFYGSGYKLLPPKKEYDGEPLSAI